MLCGILTCASLAFSQTATTSLRGVVKDPTGALVPGATVSITATSTGISQQTTSNASGVYQFPQILPARYTIKVNAAGFGQQTKSAELLVNQPATIDFMLSVQSSTVTVDVSASAQTLNTTDASLGTSDDSAEIQALPSETRNVPELLSLQPGVLYLPSATTNDSRSGAVNGSRSDQGNVTIDGIDDNDQVNGYAFTGVLRETQDSIEEFRVMTGDANADSGRSSGAQVSMSPSPAPTNSMVPPNLQPAHLHRGQRLVQQAGGAEQHLPNIPAKLLRNIYGADVRRQRQRQALLLRQLRSQSLAENYEQIQTTAFASYAAGSINYPGGSYSPSDITALDVNCQVCRTAAYPNGPGPNSNAKAYLSSMPFANGSLDGDGLNTGSYAFSSPNPQNLNTSIVRLDYRLNDRHLIFAHGNLQKDDSSAPENFPGQGPPASRKTIARA